MTLITILLAIIAYILWRMFRQKEAEKEEAANAKFDEEWERKKKEKFRDYPHLYDKLEGNWLEVFASQHEKGLPLLKMCFLLYLGETGKMNLSDGSLKWDALWNASEELLEHLEKYHEGTIAEHEIALATYWQIAAEAVSELIKENPEIEGRKLEVKPFTDINKITSLFPKKNNHPAEEISFMDEKGHFPRESKGSKRIQEKLKAIGV